MLPDVYVTASTCVIAAAICSLLLDTNDSDKNMLMLYDQIDPTFSHPHPEYG